MLYKSRYIYCIVWFVCVACDATYLTDLDSDTNTYNNSVYGDNELWSGLFEKCGKRTTFSCVEDKVFGYLENTLDTDFHVTDNIYFIKNENKYSEEVNRVSERVGRSEKHANEEFTEFVNRVESVEGLQEDINSTSENKTANIEDVTDVLYNRAVKYLVTHDLDINLPSAKLRISPKGFDEDGGALVKFNVLPNKPEQGRFLQKFLNKIFKKKLMSSFLAAMLIMKLLKIKAMFLLPVILGVGTAKKLLLKILLFLFPALAHLFKLCAYYHHHHAKYHHHHHQQIAHHHHHIPVPVYSSPHHSSVGEYPAPYSYDTTGPGGPYIHSRTDSPITDLASWGIGDYPSVWDDPRLSVTRAPDPALLKYNYQVQAQTLSQPQQLQIQNLQYAAQAQNEIKPNHKLFNGNIATPNKILAQPGGQQLYYPKQGIIQAQPVATRVKPAVPVTDYSTYDPFYSPILQKLDSVFLQLGFTDEGCRERMVCSMYKSPQRYSPHSNLISAELSRDPSELRKPLSVNPAVVRFFRYVQAARDGQELKDCLKLYAACGLTTE